MDQPSAPKKRHHRSLTRQAQWWHVLLFLVLIRLILSIPALIGANLVPLAGGVPPSLEAWANPSSVPGVWARWDSGFYLRIARVGYSFQGSEVGFFPGYPCLIRLFALGSPTFMVWSGFLFSNLAFILASLLLWAQVKADHNRSIAWATIITLNVFPTSFFFSAIYAESLFLLFSILVYWFSARKRYVLAGLFISVASVTRIGGLLLIVIPLIEILTDRPTRYWLKASGVALASAIGMSLYGLYLWMTQGHPLAFILAQQDAFKRTITWPWQTVFDGLAVATFGYSGFQENWFMRVVSLHDSLATLLFIACTILAFLLLRRSLSAYSVVAILLILVSHGPYALGLYAASRYVLILFPCFMVIGILLDRMPKLKWAIWTVSAILLCFLTAWFATGRWVA